MHDLTTYLPGIILAYSAFLLAIASPGPNILAIIGTSMSAGRPSGLALALGVAGGSFVWGMLSVIGLSALLASYAAALVLIKIFGGLYLLWLAYKSLRSAASRHDMELRQLSGRQRTPSGYMLRGFIIMMTNPKAALAWIAITSLGLSDGAPVWVGFVIVGGIFVLSVVIHALYALAFSTTFMVRIYSGARRYIQAVIGTFFAMAGINLLMSRN